MDFAQDILAPQDHRGSPEASIMEPRHHLGRCSMPLWLVDDFTPCFEQDYIQIILPLVVIAIFALLLLSNILRTVRLKRSRGYQKIGNGAAASASIAHQRTDLPAAEIQEPTEADDEGLTINGGRLALAKSKKDGSFVQADTPSFQTATVVLETLSIAGLVAINIVRLIVADGEKPSRMVAVAGLVSWLYVLMLATLRLSLAKTVWRISFLWGYAAWIYSLLWISAVIVFRSELVRPSPGPEWILAIVQFALNTLLFVLIMTTRRGNKTVLLEWEKGIEPSREALASFLSLATFTWLDPLLWKGWKQSLEMEMVWNLLPDEKASVVLAKYRTVKKTSRLSMHLLVYFKWPILIQALMSAFGSTLFFLPTLLLKTILELIETYDRDPSAVSVSILWLYVCFIPIIDVFRSCIGGFTLWIGRKTGLKMRAILIGEIYAKALRRKVSSGKDKDMHQEEKKKKADCAAKNRFLADLKKKLGLARKEDKKTVAEDDDQSLNATTVDKQGQVDEQVNQGTIINLMSIDSIEISEITAYLHLLIAESPTQLIIAVTLLWQVVGTSAIPSLIFMVILVPINYIFGRRINASQRRVQHAADKRVHMTNEVMQSIRIIKYFAWENRFAAIIGEQRLKEIQAIRARFLTWALAVAVWNAVPVFTTFFSFMVYTLYEKKPLTPSIAFTTMSLFNLLRIPLDEIGDKAAHVQEAIVSMDRVEQFLNEEETGKYEQLGEDNIDEEGNRVIGFRDSTLTWGGKAAASDESTAFRLMDLNVMFKLGKLNIIAGVTGSGKTSMLMGLLGEMSRVSGRVFCAGGRRREEVPVDPRTGLANTIAYVAQSAWLLNASIKENILFEFDFDEQRYKEVVVACALERDFEIFDNGDDTLVGDKGISLSGGQKQRICLARALYSNSLHLLLDDCLSAVDSHTAHWIFSNCIRGPLMRDRTCILVTHNVQLCVPTAEFVVVLDNGRVVAQGSPAEVISSGKLGDDVQGSSPASEAVSRIPSRTLSSVGDESTETVVDGGNAEADGSKKKDGKKARAGPEDAMHESKAVGAVHWSVIRMYFSNMGGWGFWLLTAALYSISHCSVLLSNLWVREWANQYTNEKDSERRMAVETLDLRVMSPNLHMLMDMYGKVGSWTPAANTSATGGEETLSISATAPTGVDGQHQVNVAYYLVIFGAIGFAGALIVFFRDLWIFSGSATASLRIHIKLVDSVTRAKFVFFDKTPLGQIMNRFSKDIGEIDQEVTPVAIRTVNCAISLILTIMVISSITPGFLPVGVLVVMAYAGIARFYIHASRDLKRLESVQRSPLFQQFGETLAGMTTIRAFGSEQHFVVENLHKINRQSRPFIFKWACNRWLAFRADMVSDFVAFFSGVFVIVSLGKIDAGMAGISMSYALTFSGALLWLIRLYATNEQNMNSVERVKEYLDIEHEAPPVIEQARPPKNWPSQGAVEFINYTTRYRPELEPVLRSISLKIRPGEKVGIVGRTGAGKSSLALALFRALEAESGKILIDDVDIGLIGLRDLRESITIVPQDPTLFQGTIRSNLDPFGLYTDESLFDALRQVQLIGSETTTPSSQATLTVPSSQDALTGLLTTIADNSSGDVEAETTVLRKNKNIFLSLLAPVAESGNNLSQGQRQLLCLAQAMLRKPRVLVMDEATASIDYATDSKIQTTIRQLTSTIITIAHRLQTIVDYDKVLVLDHGSVVEFGHPYELIQRGKEGSFHSMCEASGELEMLTETAKRAWKEGNLINVEE